MTADNQPMTPEEPQSAPAPLPDERKVLDHLADSLAAPACLTCNDHGAVGNILTAQPCPDCTRKAAPSAASLLALVRTFLVREDECRERENDEEDCFTDLERTQYRILRASAVQALRDALAAAPTTQPAPQQEAQEPAFWTVCAQYEGGGETGWIPLPGYSNETEHGVKALVLQAARKEGYKGTATGRLMELGWEIRPVYLASWAAAQPSPTSQEGEA